MKGMSQGTMSPTIPCRSWVTNQWQVLEAARDQLAAQEQQAGDAGRQSEKPLR